MTWTPLFDNILVELVKYDDGGIITSEPDYSQPQVGDVLACGEGTADSPMRLYEQDQVIFNLRDAIKVEIDDKNYYVLDQHDVLLVTDHA